jgi:hypothetical protein
MTEEKPWKSKSIFYKEALNYMKGLQKGLIHTYKTPWYKINKQGINGFEFNSITVIGGRPSSGKTLFVDQMVREGFELNPDINMRVLQFQFEMVGKNSAIREFSAASKQTYQYLLGAEQLGVSISNSILKICYDYSLIAAKYPIDVIDEPMTTIDIEKAINEYMYVHSAVEVKDDGSKKRIYPKLICTLDHSMLVKKGKGQNKNDVLYDLGEVLTKLKKKYPIAFFILTQLNRDIENPLRNEDGKYGNYIIPSDIFGADALNQHADTILAMTRPAQRFIQYYGPERFIIEDDSVIAMHTLKNRNGTTAVSFFKAEFHHMKISEMVTPQQDTKLKTK